MSVSERTRHRRAAEAFVEQVRERYDDLVDTVILYGSVARGEERGVASDVDLLVILGDDVDAQAGEERVRELAYGIELEYRVVLSLIVMSEATYERRADTPFFRNVREEATTLYG